MTNYNDGKWHGWNGGECPVHPESRVDIAGSWGINQEVLARHASWTNGVIAFRVVKEHRGPREFWIVNGIVYLTKRAANIAADAYDAEVVHVREVIE